MRKYAPNLKISGSKIETDANTDIYPLEAVLNATYSFIGDFYIFLTPGTGNSVRVEMSAKRKMSGKTLERHAGEFSNTLLAETLRYELGRRNKKIRETILEQAISSALSPPQADQTRSAGPAEPDRGAALLEIDDELKKIIERTRDVSYEDDPLGICIPVDDGPQAAAPGASKRSGAKKSGPKAQSKRSIKKK